jgi:hypothetical protein
MHTRKLLVTFIMILIATLTFGQKSKQVYITLDVSGSMWGDKYNLANYTAQLISLLCEDDELTVIIYGSSKKIKGSKGGYKILQINFDKTARQWKVSDQESQIKDIKEFNMIFRTDTDKEQWLFIIGDGIWDTHMNQDIQKEFKKHVSEGNLHVHFLQTGHTLEEDNDFTQFVRELNIVNILKSSIDPKTIIKNCDEVASQILGLSSESLQIKKAGGGCIEVTSLLPTEKYILIYQDAQNPTKLPAIKTAHQDGASLSTVYKGVATTHPIRLQPEEVMLSGSVWEITSGRIIPAGKTVKICFDKEPDLKKIKIFPVVEVKTSAFGFTQNGGALKKINESTYVICQDQETALITVTLHGKDGDTLPEDILKKTTVEIFSHNKSYKARRKGMEFQCEIPLTGDTTMYYSKSELAGHFSRTSGVAKIIKDEECIVPEVTSPRNNMGPIRLQDLIRGKCIDAYITDSATLEVLDPEKFDISVRHNYPLLFRRVEVRIQGNQLYLCLFPRGDWCECFFPDSLTMEILIVPKPGADFGGKIYGTRKIPTTIEIIKQSTWWSRCKWIVFTMAGLLLLIIYLFRLNRKRRFKRGAKILMTDYIKILNKSIEDQVKLRKKGLGPWINRWFNPFTPEKRTLAFFKPNVTFEFIAGTSGYRIYVPKKQFDPARMKCITYDEDDKNKHMPLSDGDQIGIRVGKPTVGEYSLTYDRNEGIRDDARLFKVFNGLLILASSALFIFLAISLFSSLR